MAPFTCSTRFPTTPDSFIRFPSISIPIRGTAEGIRSVTTIVTAIGNKIFSPLLTSLSCTIFICLSLFVVSNFIIGGCIIGTNAI